MPAPTPRTPLHTTTSQRHACTTAVYVCLSSPAAPHALLPQGSGAGAGAPVDLAYMNCVRITTGGKGDCLVSAVLDAAGGRLAVAARGGSVFVLVRVCVCDESMFVCV